jgi:acetyl esterase/lipase
MAINSGFTLSLGKWLAVAVVLLQLTACSIASLPLLIVNGMAAVGDYRLTSNLAYGSNAMQQLDVYHVERSPDSPPAAVLIFYYGGCWGACTDLHKADYRFVAQSLVDENTVVVIADYQQYPDVLFAGIMTDVTAVVTWVENNIGSYGGNPKQLFLMGHSSGAHLASMLALDEQYLPTATQANIRGFIGLAGPYDFLPFTKPYQPILFGPESHYPASQPINYVDGKEPPLLLLYGQDDDTVGEKNMLNLSAAVKASGGQIESKTYPGLSHSGLLAALSIPLRASNTVREDIRVFIAANR